MRKLTLALLLFLTPMVAAAAPLKVVTVGAPAINCIFNNPACTVVVNDTTANINLSTRRTGFLQSRTYTGQPGSPAAGLYAYEYRIDLSNALGAVAISCVNSMTLDFGPVVSTLDYNGDGLRGDQVFVVSSGGIGTIGIVAAFQIGNKVTFRFSAPVCEGGAPGRGDSTFFWGLVSRRPPRFVNATVHETGGVNHVIQARSPF